MNGKYYDGITGALVTNSYVRVGSDWYYVNSKGKRLKGAQIINNVAVYFNPQMVNNLKVDLTKTVTSTTKTPVPRLI